MTHQGLRHPTLHPRQLLVQRGDAHRHPLPALLKGGVEGFLLTQHHRGHQLHHRGEQQCPGVLFLRRTEKETVQGRESILQGCPHHHGHWALLHEALKDRRHHTRVLLPSAKTLVTAGPYVFPSHPERAGAAAYPPLLESTCKKEFTM